MIDLLPCPRCAGQAWYGATAHIDPVRFYVICALCRIRTRDHVTRLLSAEDWNTRVPTQAEAALERMTDAYRKLALKHQFPRRMAKALVEEDGAISRH